MKKLTIYKKSGFSTSLPFKIYDKNGFIFYSSDFTDKILKGNRLFFNLPIGEYFLNGLLRKENKPFEHKPIILPPYERDKGKKNYKIIFGDNPNKCTVFYDKEIILFDNSLKNVPSYMKFHIYFHELGHRYYQTEKFADLFAAKKMLELGFNISQIGYSNLEMLSETQKERKQFLINKLTKK